MLGQEALPAYDRKKETAFEGDALGLGLLRAGHCSLLRTETSDGSELTKYIDN